jgi:hypothetical protein
MPVRHPNDRAKNLSRFSPEGKFQCGILRPVGEPTIDIIIPERYRIMWTLRPTETYETRFKQAHKQYPRELASALVNLTTYHRALCSGMNPLNASFRFLHPEASGAYAIDQRGGSGKLAQLRLYIFPDVRTKTLWLLTIGDKNTQRRRDIQDCRDLVKAILSLEVKTDGHQPSTPEPASSAVSTEENEVVQDRRRDGS